MSEIIFTETEQRRDDVDTMNYGRRPTDHKLTIFQSAGKVAVVESYLVVGVPRNQRDKRYYQWRTVASAGFRRNRAGTITPFSCVRPWDAKVGTAWLHKTPNEPFNWLSSPAEHTAGEAFRGAVWEEFGVTDITQLYPMLIMYDLPTYRTIPNTLKMPFRSDDWDDFTARVFGKTRITRPLVAAVKNTEPYFVAYAQQFRGLVPDAALVNFMNTNRFDEEMEDKFEPHSPAIRSFLLQSSQTTRNNLINKNFDLADLNRIRDFARHGRQIHL